jgi:hypothetical protein
MYINIDSFLFKKLNGFSKQFKKFSIGRNFNYYFSSSKFSKLFAMLVPLSELLQHYFLFFLQRNS